jgi:hypothetical protein
MKDEPTPKKCGVANAGFPLPGPARHPILAPTFAAPSPAPFPHPCPHLTHNASYPWWLTGLDRAVVSRRSHQRGIQALVVSG